MKKFITIIGLAVLAGITPASATNWTNYPTGIPGHTDTFLFATTTTNQFGNPTNSQITADGLTQFVSTNTPYTFVANPLTNGMNYTSPPVRGFLTVNVVVTNNGTAWLTNRTTTFSESIGAINRPAATNYDLLLMRAGPGDVFMFTNFSGVGIISSRWQP